MVKKALPVLGVQQVWALYKDKCEGLFMVFFFLGKDNFRSWLDTDRETVIAEA